MAEGTGAPMPSGRASDTRAPMPFGRASDTRAPQAPLMTFVVPVYNTEATVGACLDSALAQTVRDIEVVCVDDGSPDGAGEVLDRYAARDGRVRVLHQANAGLAAARNAGMAAARGHLVAFLDSDDMVMPTFAERIARAFASARDVDVVTCGAACEPPELASARIKRLLSPADAVYRGFDADLLFSANAQPYACRTVVDRSFVLRENIRFDESLRFAEDVAFHFTVYPLARTTVLISDKLYRYRMNDDSLTHEHDGAGARERKLARHLDVLTSIFSAWDARGLGSLCPERMIAWCLDFTLFDIACLEPKASGAMARRLGGMLARAYGAAWADLPALPAVRRAAHAVADADASGIRLGRLGLARFFVATRGWAQCLERLLR